MGQKKILLVEDEAIIQTLCKRIIQCPRYQLKVVSTVKEALEALRGGAPDLLITDLKLPDGNGTKVVNEAMAQFSQCAVIVITGSPTPEKYFEDNFDQPISTVISKPFEIEILMSAIDQALQEKQ